jgi:hypothetical protein
MHQEDIIEKIIFGKAIFKNIPKKIKEDIEQFEIIQFALKFTLENNAW